MRRVVLAIAILGAVLAGASCVRHVELTPADAAIDAPYRPDASIDASTIDASPDAPPDSSIDAL